MALKEEDVSVRTKCPLCLSEDLSENISPHKDLMYPIIPVCVDTPKPEDDFAPFNICLCNNCGLIMLRETVDSEILYKIFHSDGIGGIWEAHYNSFADLIKKHCPSGKVLEIGGGQGKLITKLLERYNEGVEVIDPLYEGPKENVVVHKHLLDSSKEDEMSEKFDAVVSSHTLEHFLEFNEYFKGAWRVLKKRGLLFTSIPNQELSFSRGFGNQLNFEHPSVCMNAHWIMLYYQNKFRIKEIRFFQDHSVQIVGEKLEEKEDYSVDVKELSTKILDKYGQSMIERIEKIRQGAKPDKENWIFGASNLSQPLFLYGLKENVFEGVLDNSPLKHNKRLYGTKLNCKKPEEILGENGKNKRVFLNLAHYNNEVKEQIKGIDPEIECILL